MKNIDRMSSQLILFGITVLMLGPVVEVPAQKADACEYQMLQGIDPECQRLLCDLTTAPYEDCGTKRQWLSEHSCILPNHTMKDSDLNEVKKITPGEQFQTTNSFHMAMAEKLANIFKRYKNVTELLANANYTVWTCEVNPMLFRNAYKIRLLEGAGTCKIKLGSYIATYPMKFIPEETLHFLNWTSALEEAEKAGCLEYRDDPVRNKEDLLRYFRNDIGLNIHHDSWHQVYPANTQNDVTCGLKSSNYTRRGEMFYYFHQQLLARYNYERLSNGLSRTVPLDLQEQNLPEKLDCNLYATAKDPYPSRPANASFNGFTDDKNKTHTIKELLEKWNLIEESIQRKILNFDPEKKRNWTAEEFIDILGDMVEASPGKSPNYKTYGNLHNFGHLLISSMHDPDRMTKKTVCRSFMSDFATSLRDPAFYRWHTKMNMLFDMHKQKLPPYESKELELEKVKIIDVSVTTRKKGAGRNSFVTFWERSEVNVSDPLSKDSNEVPICYVHLQHYPFDYNITVESNKSLVVTVRIFMAPTYDEDHKVFDFTQQRQLFIEMDTFRFNLTEGSNTIVRNSADSSVTTPTRRTFQRIQVCDREQTQKINKTVENDCGWPEYLLVPQGTYEGFESKLFVILSDWKNGDETPDVDESEADSYAGTSFCGFKQGIVFPYRRPMGFPFDRMTKASTLTEFSSLPNMHVIDTTIKFTNWTQTCPDQ